MTAMRGPGASASPAPTAHGEGPRGYGTAQYSETLRALGRPRALPRSGGFLLERPVPGGPGFDGIGPYPLFVCRDWSRLTEDLDDLAGALVSVTLVADPFGDQDEALLRGCFPDLMRPFKQHRVADLSQPRESFVSAHHRRYARASRTVSVDVPADPGIVDEDWVRLYAELTARHEVRGLAAFDADALKGQLRVPGTVVFRARVEARTVGILVFYVDGNLAYYHLGAYDQEGYLNHASFALFWAALGDLGGRGVRWLDLGAGAGVDDDPASGLDRFKRGWSTGSRTAHLCGRILDAGAYEELVTRAGGREPGGFFPAYRRPPGAPGA